MHYYIYRKAPKLSAANKAKTQMVMYLVAAADLVVLLNGLVHLLQRVVLHCSR